MIKNLVAPIQMWLLSQGRCVADGKPLEEGKREEHDDGTFKVTHECGRIYIYDPKKDEYRRALLNEV